MRWKKLGRIFAPSGIHEKLATHAANPLPVHVDADVYRIFYSGRDDRNRSSVGWFDFDFGAMRVVAQCEQPAFTYGPTDSYFSHGVSTGCCYKIDSQRYILFMGWHIPENGHWRGEIGRLQLHDDLSLTLHGEEPFFPISHDDPISLSYPWVVETGSGYQMWYGSTIAWDAGNGEMLHIIKGATSVDGENWRSSGAEVPFEIGTAQAFSRPSIIANGANFDMWFSYRSGSGQSYRVGRATSSDAANWRLCLEEAEISVSENGWDSEMIEYPFILDHSGRRFMLYNGNGYGKTGIGLALWEE